MLVGAGAGGSMMVPVWRNVLNVAQETGRILRTNAYSLVRGPCAAPCLFQLQ
jgi:hypothetical protein